MSELYSLSSVKLKGGIFEGETEQPIFANASNKPRFCLLYGKNGDENWAGRDVYIKGNVKRDSSVGVETYKQFINLSTVKTRDELIVEYAKLKIDFENAKNGGKSITIPVKTRYDFNDIEAQARQLLAEKIEKLVLTEREKYLISLLKKEDGLRYLQGIK